LSTNDMIHLHHLPPGLRASLSTGQAVSRENQVATEETGANAAENNCRL